MKKLFPFINEESSSLSVFKAVCGIENLPEEMVDALTVYILSNGIDSAREQIKSYVKEYDLRNLDTSLNHILRHFSNSRLLFRRTCKDNIFLNTAQYFDGSNINLFPVPIRDLLIRDRLRLISILHRLPKTDNEIPLSDMISCDVYSVDLLKFGMCAFKDGSPKKVFTSIRDLESYILFFNSIKVSPPIHAVLELENTNETS